MTRLWFLAVLTCVIVVACERVPLTSPTGSTISVTIDQSTMPLNGQARVRAIVTESSGTPVHNGTQVSFTSSLGSFSPSEVETAGGVAISTFSSGSISGTTRINAYSGGASTGSGNSSGGGVEVMIGTAGAERISVRTDPNNIPLAGGTVVVVASLFDVSGNPIINTPLQFSADFGTLTSNSALTNANGEARVSLTTNRTTVVTVTAGSKTQAFTLNALSPPAVTLACTGSPNANVGVPVSCTITTPTFSANGSSSAPIQNVTINWGDGSGEQPLGTLNGATVVSHTYSTPGSFVVTAAATDANSQRGTAVTTLNVTRVLPQVTLEVPETGTAGVPVLMAVAPSNASAQPITTVVVDFGDGTSRTFSPLSARQGFTKTYAAEGGYTVTATATDASGQQGRTSWGIIINRGAPPVITLTNTSAPLQAGTDETFDVSASVPSGAPSISTLRVTLPDGFVLYNGPAPGSFLWTPTVSGPTTFTIVATDSVGNTTTSVRTLTVQ